MGLINFEVPKIPAQKMEEFIWVITGRNKIGKTTLASMFPKPYFFKFEPGTSGLLTYETDIVKEAIKQKKHPWVVFRQAVNQFVENDGYGFKTAVTDPAGVGLDYCQDYICKKLGIEHPSDLGFGKGWSEVSDEYISIVRMLSTSKFTPLFISHLKPNKQHDGMGGEKDVLDLNLSGKSGEFLKNFTDIFLLLDYDSKGERKIYVRPTTNKEAGSRVDFGQDVLPLEYQALKEAFDNAIKENNKKQGVTEQMIKDYYAKIESEEKAEENKKKLKEKLKEIGEVAVEKGLNKKTNPELMEKIIGISKISEINDLSLADKYLKYLKEKYKGE